MKALLGPLFLVVLGFLSGTGAFSFVDKLSHGGGLPLEIKWSQESACNFHPALWCSSRRIAAKCKVTSQCEMSVWAPQRATRDDRVQFALYFESLCPDCQQFVTDQLWPTFQKIGSIMDLFLVPYGNAREKQVGDHWQFDCQHGQEECLGNMIETCALHLLPSINASFPFVACMEMSSKSVNDSAVQCAKDQGVDLAAIMQCVSGPLGNKLEHEMAVKTNQLDPPHESVPWVTLNGEHTDEIEEKAESDLLGLICDTYKGKAVPDACKSAKKSSCLRHLN